MTSLRAALDNIGVRADTGLRRVVPVRPPGVRELIRVANLPAPRLADLEPDDPHAFESFEVEDPQGIIHAGGQRWFLSSQFAIRRVSIQGADPFRPTRVDHGPRRRLDELLDEAGLPDEFDHFGDLAFANSIVYVPVRNEGDREHVVMGLSADLAVVGWARLAVTGGESACAVHPWNGLLYVPRKDAAGHLEAYDISAFEARRERPAEWGGPVPAPRRGGADLRLKSAAGADENEGIQGFMFSPNGRTYVTRSGGEPYHNRLFVYSTLSGRRLSAEREWNFPGDDDEIEGIALHPSGVIYIAVNDNDNEFLGTDDFDLHTFRFPALEPTAV